MTSHEITCTGDPDDCFTVERESDDVYFVARDSAGRRVTAYVTPLTARTFARGILALADEIDGGETEEAPKRTPQVGDRVRVLYAKYRRRYHGVIGTVVSTTDAWQPMSGPVHPYRVKIDGEDYDVWAAEVEILDEPAGLLDEAGLAEWERSLIESAEASAAEPVPSSFAVHVGHAKALLAGTDHCGADVIRLAEILSQQ